MELQVLQSSTENLITAVKGSINAINGQCHGKGLISEETHGHILHSQGTNGDKARYLLEAVTNCVKTNPSCYNTFIEILDQELPDRGKKVLDDMKQDLKEKQERRKVMHCTDDVNQGKTGTPLRVEDIDTHLKSVSNGHSLRTVTRKSDSKSGGEGTVTKRRSKVPQVQEGGVTQPIQVSEPSGDVPAYLLTESPSSARLRTLKSIAEQAQLAIQDAQQDEAVQQEMREERRKLTEERDRLKEELKEEHNKLEKAIEKEEELKKKLEEEQAHLRNLEVQKDQEKMELKHKYDDIQKRLSSSYRERKGQSQCHMLRAHRKTIKY